MSALIVPVDNLMEWFVYDVEIADLLDRFSITHPVTVNFGTNHVEHGQVTFTLDETQPVNARATKITALLTRGSHVRINGTAVFAGLSEGEVTEILRDF